MREAAQMNAMKAITGMAGEMSGQGKAQVLNAAHLIGQQNMHGPMARPPPR